MPYGTLRIAKRWHSLKQTTVKGKKQFSQSEITELKSLIKERIKADRSRQKGIRARMRKIGFYGSDFGINDLQPSDFDNLIRSGSIKVFGQGVSQSKVAVSEKPKPIAKQKKSQSDKGDFQLFDPIKNSADQIPDTPGNYIICLRKGSKLPDVGIEFETKPYKGLKVIYTGIAGKSLRKRDYRQHFTGNNAGSSTLRKSIGSLFGYPKIARDKNADNGKTKFNLSDEMKLSEWMIKNLLLYFKTNSNPDEFENVLISTLNPPLNLSKNKNLENIEFRKRLSELRKNK
jgi:hypothetical protein